MNTELIYALEVGFGNLVRVLASGGSTELLLVLATGGLTIVGTFVGWLGNFATTEHNRKAGAQEKGHERSVEACAEFVGVSFHVFTRRYECIVDMVQSVMRDNGKPVSAYSMILAAKEVLSPLAERLYVAVVRAETYAPTTQSFTYIHEINLCQSGLIDLFLDAAKGNLPDNWDVQLDALKDRHDAAAQALTEELRFVDARASHRVFVPGRSAKPEAPDNGKAVGT